MKRLLGIALALLLVLSAVGVAQATTTTAATDASGKCSDTLIQPEIFIRAGNTLWTGDELIWQAIADKTNIKFKPIPVATADFTDKLNVTLASGDLPDYMECPASVVDKYGPQGAFVNLSPTIDAGGMPNFMAALDRNNATKIARSPDGNYYGGPRLYDMDFRLDESYTIRKDVLDKNNIPMPTTWDELYDAMAKLKAIYPDSTPITSRWEAVHIIEGMSNVRDSFESFYVPTYDDSQVSYGPTRPGYKDALTFLAKCYAGGVLDPEFPTLTDEQWNEKFINGQAFFAFDYADSFDTITAQAQQVDPDWNMVPWLQPEYNGQLYGTIVLKGYYGMYHAISDSSPYKDALVKFLDWTYSPEGIETLQFGIEGDTYTKDTNGNIELANDIIYPGHPDGTRDAYNQLDLSDSNLFSVSTATDRDIYNLGGPIMQAAFQLAKDNHSYGPSYFYIKFGNQDDSDRYAELRNAIDTYIIEQSVKVITGEMSIDQWDTTVIPTAQNMGLDEALTLVNAAYANMNK